MKKLISTYLLISIIGFLSAQEHNEQVTVIAPYQPAIMDAYKININPRTLDTSFSVREMQYDILSRKIMTSYSIENIKPAKVSGEPITKLSPLHVKAGIGNYSTPYVEAFFGSLRSQGWQYGAHVKHLSSQGKLSNADFNHMNSINQMEVFGSMYLDNFQMKAELFYDRQRYSTLYGTGRDTTYENVYSNNENMRRVYSNVGVNLTFGDNQPDADKLKYNGSVAFNNLSTNFGAKENSLLLDVDMNYLFKFNGKISQAVLGATLDADLNNTKSHVQTDFFSYNTIKIQPYGKMQFAGHDFKAGLKFNTYALDHTQLQFVPVIEAKFNLIPSVFAVYLGMDGDVRYTTLKFISDRNPYIFLLNYKPEQVRNYYIGFTTAVTKRIDFKLEGSLNAYKDLLSFQPLPMTDLPLYQPAYYDVNGVRLQADVNYYIDEKFVLNAMGRLNYYDEDVPYKPQFEAKLNLRYALQDKIILKTQLYAYSKMLYLDGHNSNKLNGFIDWSLGVEYKFNNRYSAFFDMNNLLNQRYFQWYQYPSYRLNVMLGATFTL